MIAEVIVVVAGEERKHQASPQFTEIARNIAAELADAIGQQRVGARIALRKSQQGRRGNKRNAVLARAIESGNDRDTMPIDRHEPMLRNLNARAGRKRQRENFARRNVPRIIRLGKLREGEPFIRQRDRRLGPRPAQWRTCAQ